MFDPLYWDIACFVFPVVIGAALFALGIAMSRVPRPLRYAAITLAVAIVMASGIGLAGHLPFAAWAVVSYLGGSTMLLAWTAIFLAAIVWRIPRRSFSTPFLVFLIGISGVLLTIEAGGRLWWRFFAPDLWANRVDEQGLVQQSSGMTCSPTAAAMLLHDYGVPSSEGEMAYLAGTSMFGTDAFAMARAISRKISERGLYAQAIKTSYDAQLRTGSPFIAHIRAQVGGHAVLVEAMSPHFVDLRDPATGERERMPRATFEELWDGTAIEIASHRTE